MVSSLPSLEAQEDTPLDLLFTIRDIKLDETARSAAEARLVALAKAEEIAYEKLLGKLTQAEARDRLPPLSKAARQSLISGIELVDEQSSSRRYLVTLNVRFDPDSVSDFFARYDVPHVLAAGRPILVLHAHSRGLSTVFWEKDPLIEAARESVDWVNRIRAYRFARGEIRERLALSATEVQANSSEAALRVSRLNGLNSALLISSEKTTGPEGVALAFTYFATDSDVQGEGYIPIAYSTPEAEAAALSDMYSMILEAIDSAWRERLLVDTGEQGTLKVIIPSSSFDQFREIERRLETVNLIKSLKINEISIPASRITLDFTGKQDQLVLALRFAGLDLKPYGADMLIDLRDQ